MSDEHIEPRAMSDEALDELGRAMTKILGIPGSRVVGFVAAVVVADPESRKAKVTGAVWGLRDDDTANIAEVVRQWLEASSR